MKVRRKRMQNRVAFRGAACLRGQDGCRTGIGGADQPNHRSFVTQRRFVYKLDLVLVHLVSVCGLSLERDIGEMRANGLFFTFPGPGQRTGELDPHIGAMNDGCR
jgi:hypothetical protein